MALLKGLSYDRNIVQFYGVCPQPGGEPPLLVLEYMAGVSDIDATTTKRSIRHTSGSEHALCDCLSGRPPPRDAVHR